MTKCPFCFQDIPDDSLYCDQCGKQLQFCPNCHKPGAGKICGHCGTPMNAQPQQATPFNPFASHAQQASPAPQQPPVSNPFAKQPSAANPFVQQPKPQPITVSELWLSISALPAPFKVQPGDFGRNLSPMNPNIAPFDTISGRHGVFQCKAGEWTFADVGSSNGTLHNGRLMAVNREETLRSGDTLQMGEALFKVSLK